MVIAIIAILAAMLLPALNSAREKAKATNCISNLKQLSLMIPMYTGDFDGNMPNLWSTEQASWHNVIVTVVKGLSTWTTYRRSPSRVDCCPSWAPYTLKLNSSATEARRIYGFGNNTVLNKQGNTINLIKTIPDTLNFKNLWKPSRNMMIADSVDGMNKNAEYQCYNFYSSYTASGPQMRVSHPGEKVSILFADMHVGHHGIKEITGKMHFDNSITSYITANKQIIQVP